MLVPSCAARICVLSILLVGASPVLTRVGGVEPARPIAFRCELRESGVADKIVLRHSPDKSVELRVVGERRRAGVRLFDATKGEALGPVIELKAHRITALAVSADNRTVATAIGNFSNDWGEVRVWNGESGKEIARYTIDATQMRPPLGEVFRLSFSEDGMTVTIVTGPYGGR